MKAGMPKPALSIRQCWDSDCPKDDALAHVKAARAKIEKVSEDTLAMQNTIYTTYILPSNYLSPIQGKSLLKCYQ